MKTPYTIPSLFTVIAFSFFLTGNVPVYAEEVCTFSETLETGKISEEVRCLQRYLNSSGYTITTSGGGSPGSETSTFGEKTREAVKRWQIANGIYPATGNFGPLSKSVYEVLTKKKPTQQSTTSATSSNTSQTTTVISNTSNTTASSNTTSSLEKKAKDLMKKVRDAIDEADDKIDDAKDDGTDVGDMEKLSEKAKDKLIDAVYAYIDGDYNDAIALLTRAQKYSDDSIEDIVDEEEQSDAEDAIADAKKALNEARDAINEAEDDEEDTDDARDLYDDAKSKYDDARQAFDDEEYADAIDLANEAEDLADEAVDAL